LIELNSDHSGRTFGNQCVEEIDFLHIYEPQIKEEIRGKFLVLHTEKIKNKRDGKWVDTKDKQLHFIRVDSNNIKLSFTVENSDLFIGLRLDTVYFLRETNIVFWKWGSNQCESVRCFP
jgi:hypothetical protein